MSNLFLSIAWGVLYLACAGLGFISQPNTVASALMFFFSLLFFVPPGILLYRSIRAGERKVLRRICAISTASLCLTVLLMVLNILSVGYSAAAGQVLYALLVVLSAPMICGRIWLISLFLWACLLVVACKHLRAKPVA